MIAKDKFFFIETVITGLLLVFSGLLVISRLHLYALTILLIPVGLLVSCLLRRFSLRWVLYVEAVLTMGILIRIIYCTLTSSFVYQEVIYIAVTNIMLLITALSFAAFLPGMLTYIQILTIPVFFSYPVLTSQPWSGTLVIPAYIICWLWLIKLKSYEYFETEKIVEPGRMFSFSYLALFCAFLLGFNLVFPTLFPQKNTQKEGFFESENTGLEGLEEGELEKQYYMLRDKLQSEINQRLPRVNSAQDRYDMLAYMGTMMKETPNSYEIQKAENGLVTKLPKPGPGDEDKGPGEKTITLKKKVDLQIVLNTKSSERGLADETRKSFFDFRLRMNAKREMKKLKGSKGAEELKQNKSEYKKALDKSSLKQEDKERAQEHVEKASEWKALELYRKEFQAAGKAIANMQDKQEAKALEGALMRIEQSADNSELTEAKHKVESISASGEGSAEAKEILRQLKDLADLKAIMMAQDKADAAKKNIDESDMPESKKEEVKAKLKEIANTEKHSTFLNGSSQVAKDVQEQTMTVRKSVNEVLDLKADYLIDQAVQAIKMQAAQAKLPDSVNNDIGESIAAMLRQAQASQGQETEQIKLSAGDALQKINEVSTKGLISTQSASQLKEQIQNIASGMVLKIEMKQMLENSQSQAQDEKIKEMEQAATEAAKIIEAFVSMVRAADSEEKLKQIKEGLAQEIERLKRMGVPESEINELKEKVLEMIEQKLKELKKEQFVEAWEKIISRLEFSDQSLKENLKKALEEASNASSSSELEAIKNSISGDIQGTSAAKKSEADKAQALLQAVISSKAYEIKMKQEELDTVQEEFLKQALAKLNASATEEFEKIESQLQKQIENIAGSKQEGQADKKEALSRILGVTSEVIRQEKKEYEEQKKDVESSAKSESKQFQKMLGQLMKAIEQLNDKLKESVSAGSDSEKAQAEVLEKLFAELRENGAKDDTASKEKAENALSAIKQIIDASSLNIEKFSGTLKTARKNTSELLKEDQMGGLKKDGEDINRQIEQGKQNVLKNDSVRIDKALGELSASDPYQAKEVARQLEQVKSGQATGEAGDSALHMLNELIKNASLSGATKQQVSAKAAALEQLFSELKENTGKNDSEGRQKSESALAGINEIIDRSSDSVKEFSDVLAVVRSGANDITREDQGNELKKSGEKVKQRIEQNKQRVLENNSPLVNKLIGELSAKNPSEAKDIQRQLERSKSGQATGESGDRAFHLLKEQMEAASQSESGQKPVETKITSLARLFNELKENSGKSDPSSKEKAAGAQAGINHIIEQSSASIKEFSDVLAAARSQIKEISQESQAEELKKAAEKIKQQLEQDKQKVLENNPAQVNRILEDYAKISPSEAKALERQLEQVKSGQNAGEAGDKTFHLLKELMETAPRSESGQKSAEGKITSLDRLFNELKENSGKSDPSSKEKAAGAQAAIKQVIEQSSASIKEFSDVLAAARSQIKGISQESQTADLTNAIENVKQQIEQDKQNVLKNDSVQIDKALGELSASNPAQAKALERQLEQVKSGQVIGEAGDKTFHMLKELMENTFTPGGSQSAQADILKRLFEQLKDNSGKSDPSSIEKAASAQAAISQVIGQSSASIKEFAPVLSAARSQINEIVRGGQGADLQNAAENIKQQLEQDKQRALENESAGINKVLEALSVNNPAGAKELQGQLEQVKSGQAAGETADKIFQLLKELMEISGGSAQSSEGKITALERLFKELKENSAKSDSSSIEKAASAQAAINQVIGQSSASVKEFTSVLAAVRSHITEITQGSQADQLKNEVENIKQQLEQDKRRALENESTQIDRKLEELSSADPGQAKELQRQLQQVKSGQAAGEAADKTFQLLKELMETSTSELSSHSSEGKITALERLFRELKENSGRSDSSSIEKAASAQAAINQVIGQSSTSVKEFTSVLAAARSHISEISQKGQGADLQNAAENIKQQLEQDTRRAAENESTQIDRKLEELSSVNPDQAKELQRQLEQIKSGQAAGEAADKTFQLLKELMESTSRGDSKQSTQGKLIALELLFRELKDNSGKSDPSSKARADNSQAGINQIIDQSSTSVKEFSDVLAVARSQINEISQGNNQAAELKVVSENIKQRVEQNKKQVLENNSEPINRIMEKYSMTNPAEAKELQLKLEQVKTQQGAVEGTDNAFHLLKELTEKLTPQEAKASESVKGASLENLFNEVMENAGKSDNNSKERSKNALSAINMQISQAQNVKEMANTLVIVKEYLEKMSSSEQKQEVKDISKDIRRMMEQQKKLALENDSDKISRVLEQLSKASPQEAKDMKRQLEQLKDKHSSAADKDSALLELKKNMDKAAKEKAQDSSERKEQEKQIIEDIRHISARLEELRTKSEQQEKVKENSAKLAVAAEKKAMENVYLNSSGAEISAENIEKKERLAEIRKKFSEMINKSSSLNELMQIQEALDREIAELSKDAKSAELKEIEKQLQNKLSEKQAFLVEKMISQLRKDVEELKKTDQQNAQKLENQLDMLKELKTMEEVQKKLEEIKKMLEELQQSSQNKVPPPEEENKKQPWQLIVLPFDNVVLPGTSQQIKVIGVYNESQLITLNSGMEWSSTKPEVASVDNTGMLSAVMQGQTEINVKFRGVKSGAFKVSVVNNVPEADVSEVKKALSGKGSAQ